MAIQAILLRDEPSERRREDRWRVRLGARWLDSGSEARCLTILDLSTSGFLIETDQMLWADSCLIVEMPGEVSKICKTVWKSGKLQGAIFSEPLSEAELQDLIGSSAVVWPLFGRGARTASSVEPVEPSSQIVADPHIDDADKLPVAIRMMIIVGSSAGLWALIGASLWWVLD